MEMTKEEILQKTRDVEDKIQDDFIDKIYTDVSFLLKKAIKKDYIPTNHERKTFDIIRRMLNNANDWF